MRWILMLVLFSCASANKETKSNPSYDASMIDARTQYKLKNYVEAQKSLESINDSNLQPTQLAEKYNLLGSIHFAQADYLKSKRYFIKSLDQNFQDEQLLSKIYLNIASVDYKLKDYTSALISIDKIGFFILDDNDKIKFANLKIAIGKNLSQNKTRVEGEIEQLYASDDTSLASSEQYKKVFQNFLQLSDLDKELILDRLINSGFPVVNKIFTNYLMLVKDQQLARYNYLQNKYKTSSDQTIFQDNTIPEPIEKFKIGLVLPLSSEKGEFGKKVLLGLTLANEQLGSKYEFIIKDSQNSSTLSAKMVEQLVIEDKVSLIIGGLYTTTSEDEYMMAKKLGTIYIALSQVLSSKKNKDTNLVEISGSIESIVDSVLKSPSLVNLGKRFALVYSNDESGLMYAKEFWSKSQELGFQLVAASEYKKNSIDFRDPIKNMLGLKFIKERQEEYDLWESVFKIQFKNKFDRVQVLKPVENYDWIFVTAHPQEFVQVLSAFQYLEAKKLYFVGAPSWRSSSLLQLGQQMDLSQLKLIFADQFDVKKNELLKTSFMNKYQKENKLIETIGYEAFAVAHNVLDKQSFSSRSELKELFSKQTEVEGYSGKWQISEGLRLKNLSLSHISENSFFSF